VFEIKTLGKKGTKEVIDCFSFLYILCAEA